jgi:hypothetical protein
LYAHMNKIKIQKKPQKTNLTQIFHYANQISKIK